MSDRSSPHGCLTFFLTFTFGRKGAYERRQRASYPDEPWRWREDWEQGVIPAFRRLGLVALWLLIFGVLSGGIAAVYLTWSDMVHAGIPPAWILVSCSLLGLVVLARPCIVTVRAIRYGRPILCLESTPCILGGVVRGTIKFPGRYLPAVDGVLELQERRTTAHDSDDGTEPRVVWSALRVVSIPLGSRTVDVEFPLPCDALPVSDRQLLGPQTEWRLCLRATTAGPKLNVVFELPVGNSPGGNAAQTKASIKQAEDEREPADVERLLAARRRHRVHAARFGLGPR
jgi:hypothetical protein